MQGGYGYGGFGAGGPGRQIYVANVCIPCANVACQDRALTVSSFHSTSAGRTSRISSVRLVSNHTPYAYIPSWRRCSHQVSTARNGAVIRADVHVGPDGRPKGSGIVVFENPDDARNAIAQFNGYDWQGRLLEVREDRYAGAPPMGGFGPPRGGFGGRGGFAGGFGGRGGFAGRGGFGGGFGARGGYGGPGFDPTAMAPAQPNPFTDFATAGGERSETIYVKNVSFSEATFSPRRRWCRCRLC